MFSMFWYLTLVTIYSLVAFAGLAIIPSVTHGRVRYYACYVLYGFSQGLCAFFLLPLSIIYFRNPKLLGISSDLVSLISHPLGITWEVRNEKKLKKGTKAIIVANHQSMLDVLGMQYMHRMMGTYTSLAKKELLYFIPWGPATWLAGLIYLDRNDPQSKIAAIKQAFHHFNHGVKIWFFAEGTRNTTQKELLPFKKGAFQMAVECRTGIIPVVFSPYSFIEHDKKEFKRGRVIISVLDEIKIEGETTDEVDRLLKETHTRMSEEYKRTEIQFNLFASMKNSTAQLCWMKRKLLIRHLILS